jgi:hypothetical protein
MAALTLGALPGGAGPIAAVTLRATESRESLAPSHGLQRGDTHVATAIEHPLAVPTAGSKQLGVDHGVRLPERAPAALRRRT